MVELEEEVAERKRKEVALRKVNRAYKVLSTCNQLMIRAKEEKELLQGPAASSQRRADTAIGRGPSGTAIRTGRPSVNRNIQTDPNFKPWRAEATKRGYASSIALPLIVEKQTIGALSIYANEASSLLLNAWQSEVNQPLPDGWLDFNRKVLRSGKTKNTECECSGKTYSLTFAPVADAGYTNLYGLDITERKKAEQILRESEERYHSLTQTATDAIISIDSKGVIVSWNRGAQEMFGYTEEEVLNKPMTLCMPERYREAYEKGMKRLLATGEPHIVGKTVESYGLRKNGDEFPMELSLSSWETAEGRFFTEIIRDISERRKAEEEMRKIMEDIKKAGQRGAGLTEQLLSFSRKQAIQPEILALNTVVEETEKMLGRLIGEDIELTTDLESKLWLVKADQGQIDQILMNLTINARDAMTEGGKIVVKTENVDIDEKFCQSYSYARPGRFVCLSVEDTGVGMDQETLSRVFEPFFTTKEISKGTGLGLSVIYGIVKQHEGWVNVCSEPGQGSVFRVYLPASFTSEGKEAEEEVPLKKLQGHGERVLLVKKPELKVLLSSGYLDDKSQWSVIRERGFNFLQKPYTLAELLKSMKKALE